MDYDHLIFSERIGANNRSNKVSKSMVSFHPILAGRQLTGPVPTINHGLRASASSTNIWPVHPSPEYGDQRWWGLDRRQRQVLAVLQCDWIRIISLMSVSELDTGCPLLHRTCTKFIIDLSEQTTEANSFKGEWLETRRVFVHCGNSYPYEK
jgi:hypothetical protein